MARWLMQQFASDHLRRYAVNFPATSLFAVAAELVVTVCCVTLILSMCALYKRRQVGDRATSSDGDGSPTANGRQGLCLKTRKGSSQRLMKHSGREEEEEMDAGQGIDQVQQQGKLSPHVWQRAILMGERCQRPTFSGLVLYDERGNPLPPRNSKMTNTKTINTLNSAIHNIRLP